MKIKFSFAQRALAALTASFLCLSVSAQQQRPPVQSNTAPTPQVAPIATTQLAPQAAQAIRDMAQRDYQRMQRPEISFETFLQGRMLQATMNPGSVSRTAAPGNQMAGQCINGNFEPALNSPAAWNGASGTYSSSSGVSLTTPGLAGGALNLPTSHQTQVSAPGVDAFAPLLPVTPNATGNAVRLGNQFANYGAESLTKTFVASTPTIGFMYALVLENPAGHPPADQPGFAVRVLVGGVDYTFKNANNTPRTTPRVNLSANSNQVYADAANPFFKVSTNTGNQGAPIVYKDWTCSTIDVADLVGQTITIEYVTHDCGQGAHAGWAYIDDFCATCSGTNSTQGSFSFNQAASACGKLCFDYSVPKVPGSTATGTATMTLDIIQNGVVKKTLNSGVKNANGQWCFDIDSAALTGIDMSLGGFDYTATANFAIGSYTGLPPIHIGAMPAGTIAGNNNDYALPCGATSSGASTCCPPVDKAHVDGMFEARGVAGQKYVIDFKPAAPETTSFINGLNAYLQYLKFVCPSVANLRAEIYMGEVTPPVSGVAGPLTGADATTPKVIVPANPTGGMSAALGSFAYLSAQHTEGVWTRILVKVVAVNAAGQPVNCGFDAQKCMEGDTKAKTVMSAGRLAGGSGGTRAD